MHTQCKSWPYWPRVNLTEHSPTCTEIPWFLPHLTSTNPSAGIRVAAPFPVLLLPCFSSLLFVSRIFSSLLGVYFTLLEKSPDHVSLSHTITDAWYGNIPASARSQCTEHLDSCRDPVSSLQQPMLAVSNWVVSLLHAFLDLKRRGLKRSIFHAYKVGYS